MTSLYDLKQIIKSPTRITEDSESLIDLVFTNVKEKIAEVGLFDPGLSDHSLVYCILKSGLVRSPPKTIEFCYFKNYNKQSFINDLQQIPWHIVFNSTDNIDE
jgi:hypothetical protein